MLRILNGGNILLFACFTKDIIDANEFENICEFFFQIVKSVSKEVKTNEDVRKIFRVLKQTVYADNDGSKVNVSTILTQQKDSLIHIMGQDFYAALKGNKFVAGDIKKLRSMNEEFFRKNWQRICLVLFPSYQPIRCPTQGWTLFD